MNQETNSEDFRELLRRALPKYDSTKQRKGAKVKRGGYNGKKTHKRKTGDTSD